jgi:arsenate reductase-like glutaredoxin family protein
LDNGLTLENFMHYASCLSKRHILAFLEDNPDFQKVNFFGIPPIQDDWKKYKTAVVRDIIATEKKVREQDEQNHKDEVADSALKTALAHLKSRP